MAEQKEENRMLKRRWFELVRNFRPATRRQWRPSSHVWETEVARKQEEEKS
jgi:hypothetical protein